ncbi:regulator of volume decrease after cellular swelling-domain-containing protein [Glomus cerebriforme]|uniref:Regulator of volume decrease after cellular swelling-domain-containing protein n=1 Tax=Glomus cerebriforme TaxID=658196 RepID=A0A397SRS8_9GLOM|nr:regulator of volume decrease after cellular swelling-domain-containing protein [Glomus cerebriforme]
MAITLISTPPAVITREQARQLQRNSPDSIIEPIAHHIQQNVRVQPAFDATLGKGTLWVTESKLYFYSWDTNTGLAIDYPTIIIHAISRQQALDGTGPCIYTQLNEKLNMSTGTLTQQPSASSTSQDEDEDDHTTELKFIPDDIGALDAIFEALSECAALHPDKEFMEEEDPDDEFYYGNGNNDVDSQWFTAAPNDEQELSEIGRASLAYLESIIDRPSTNNTITQPLPQNDLDEEMFQDAEEDTK